jgi:hypothetical protein
VRVCVCVCVCVCMATVGLPPLHTPANTSTPNPHSMAEIEHFVNPNDKAHPKFKHVARKELVLFPNDDQLGSGKTRVMSIGVVRLGVCMGVCMCIYMCVCVCMCIYVCV